MEKIYQNGDILVFKAGDHWLSQSIALLTHSDVSHAAIVYQDDTVLEMELQGIQKRFIEVSRGDNAYLMRLNPPLDPQWLVDAATVYLNAQTRYDLPAIVILAGLLIYREVRPTSEFAAIADIILRSAAKLLDTFIQKVILDKPDKAMVCSQMVYQVYADCPPEYHIKIEHGLLKCSDSGTLRLIDLMHDKYPDDNTQPELMVSVSDDDTEELARRLCEAITKQDKDDSSDSLLANAYTLTKPAYAFLKRLEEFLEKIEADIPLDALFVMPADLVYNAKNLSKIAELNVIRHS